MFKEVALLSILCLFMVNGNVEDNSAIKDLFNINMLTKFVKMNKFFREKNFDEFGNASSKMQSLPKLSVECTAVVANLTLPFLGLNTSEIIKKLFTSPLGKYVDALPKPQGILQGNLKWLGSYDECISIDSAKYCLAQLQVSVIPLQGHVGVCVPKQCTEEDIVAVLNNVAAYTKKAIVFSQPVTCNSPPQFKTGAIITMVICGLFMFLCIFGTLLDDIKGYSNFSALQIKYESNQSQLSVNGLIEANGDIVEEKLLSKSSKLKEFFLCFSCKKNIPIILSTLSPKGAVESLNGIRVISMTWVILGHMYFVPVSGQLPENLLSSMKTIHSFSFLAVANAYVSVDSFFMLSGFLVTYLSLRKMDSNNGKLPIWKFYIHRFIRLTPTYGFVILIWLNLFPLALTGPYAKQIQNNGGQKSCSKYWWSNLLYINNFYPPNMMKQCLGWSWYLANDMQFYIISPIILYALYWLDKKHAQKSKRYVLPFLLFGVLTSISLLCTALIVGLNDYPTLITALFLPNNPRFVRSNGYQNNVYEKPYTRFSAYVIGMLLGYILSRNISVKEKYKKVFFFTGWCFSISIALAVVYGPWHVFKIHGYFFNDAENVIYGTFHRVAWSCAVAWVVYACHVNAGGMINKFLSWRFWIPLSRLTFDAYLVHYFVIMYFYYVQETGIFYQTNMMVFNFVSVTVISYACAFILALCVEYPTFNLEKMIFGIA